MSKCDEKDTSKVVFSDQDGYERIPNRVLRCPDLKPGPKMLLCALMSYCHGNGKRSCWPSQERLASDFGVSTRTIRGWLRHLEAAGLITAEQRGLGKSNRYILDDSCFPEQNVVSVPDRNEPSVPEWQEDSVPVGSQLPTNTTSEQDNRTPQHQHGNNGGGEVHTHPIEQQTLIEDLVDIGMNNAETLVSQYDNHRIRLWLDYVNGPGKTSLRNPAGFVRQMLRDGTEPPAPKEPQIRDCI